jgi:hypothetical protein
VYGVMECGMGVRSAGCGVRGLWIGWREAAVQVALLMMCMQHFVVLFHGVAELPDSRAQARRELATGSTPISTGLSSFSCKAR